MPKMMRCRLVDVLMAVLVIVACISREAVSADAYPEFCRAEVLRIERAYQAGIAAAADEVEKLECARFRLAAQYFLVDSAYQSTLAWLAEHGGLMRAVEEDQARWLAELEQTAGRMELPGQGNREACERISERLLARLAFFGRITAKQAFSTVYAG